ncbi:MAG: ABC transporter permease [Spirochaetales bacterium]
MRKAVAALLLTIGPWWALSLILGPRVVPAPPAVFARFWELLTDGLWLHAGASLARVLFALALAAIVAVPLGIALGRSQRLDRLLSPAAYLLYPVPKIALLPILLLLFGTGDLTRVIVVFLVLFFQVLLAVRDGARSVSPIQLRSIDSLGGGRWDRFRFVIWPSVVPRLLTALRVGSGTALAVLFFAETFFTRFGLGFFIVDSWMKLSYLDMFAGILAISLLGLLLFTIIDLIERRVTRWAKHS